MALDAMRANKARSALTVLGVIIGVATVMTMASIVQGVRTQIFNALETAGPTAFYVMRYFSQTPINPDNLPYEVRIRPVLKESDAEAIAQIPEVQYAGMWIQIFARIESRGSGTHSSISTPGGTSITFAVWPHTSASTARMCSDPTNVARAEPRASAPQAESSALPRIEYSSSEPCALTANGAPAAAPTGPPSRTWFVNTTSAGSSARIAEAFASTHRSSSTRVQSCTRRTSYPS